LNESIFNNERALCENDIERMSVRSTDLRLVVENVYKTEGIMPTGKSRIEGVLKDNEINSIASLRRLSKNISEGNIPRGPLRTSSLVLSNFLQRSCPRLNFAIAINDFHTLPTPANEKYHPSR
jgi:hypothetical protein